MYLQFQNEHHLIFVLESIMKIDQLRMMELVHNWDLILHSVFVQGVGCVDEFGYKYTTCSFLYAPMHNTKGTTVNLKW